jgi:hypothetical protein
MRVLVVYKESTDYARQVIDYIRDFERQTGRKLEIINPDTPQGTEFCRVYDIVEYPTLIALADDGTMQTFWRGLPLPTISEVSYYG